MSQITDSTLAAIAEGVSTGGLSKANAQAIFNLVRLLRASRSLDDASVFAPIQSLPNGRFIVSAVGKWAISFQISPGHGLYDLRLEKQGKSWSKKNSRPSSLKHQGKS